MYILTNKAYKELKELSKKQTIVNSEKIYYSMGLKTVLNKLHKFE